MFRFVLCRSAYSLLILLGVVLLTFLLFNVAAGDPAAAALGKDPAPGEVEALRRELGADLPLLWGRECRTEFYPSFDGGSRRLPPGVAAENGGFVLTPQLKHSGEILIITVESAGEVTAVNAVPEGGGRFRVTDPAAPVILLGDGIGKVTASRLQEKPWNSQFVRTLGEIITFIPEFPYVKVLDFGRTLTTREPVSRILARGIGPSLAVMLPVFAGELVIGIVLALLCAAFRDRLLDRILVTGAVAGMSVSYLVLIIFVQWYLGYYRGLFPVWGWGGLRFVFLPVLAGIVSGLGGNVRFYRTVFIDELKKEYLRTAAAKGCHPWRIYGVHLLRNAAVPIIARASASLPFLFTGSLLLESFFGIPGLGFASVDALNNSDLQLLKALVIVSALLFVVLNLLSDLAYAWFDPRIRLE